ncbi:MAG: hypothetical protein JJU36_09440 [Phycisphaeraceae bacterium]|nr:hypothetical protein [Phycisphaeraceae bacterium]
MKRIISLALLTLMAGGCVTGSPADRSEARKIIKQDLTVGDFLLYRDDPALIGQIIHKGRLQRYDPAIFERGLHFAGGREAILKAHIKPHDHWSSHIIGVRGDQTHIRFRGFWQGDATLGIPKLVLTDGGRFTVEPEARVNFVMAGNLYTRQLWVHGDGTGTLELDPGFVADRAEDGTRPDGMGTIRLGGATLITHHSQSLPFNTRPDGRGGTYPNGHIVFEHQPGSVWHVRSRSQVYPASIDFFDSGIIDTQAHLTHIGRRRDALGFSDAGEFTSIGTFGTLNENKTITKRGPAMLSLEGDQVYMPGSVFEVKAGMLRMYTDPGAGHRVRRGAGPYLTIQVHDGASLLMSGASAQSLQRIELRGGARAWFVRDTRVLASEGVHIDEGATFNMAGDITADVESRGTLELFQSRGNAAIKGDLTHHGPVVFRVSRSGPTPLLTVTGAARVNGEASIHFEVRRPGDLEGGASIILIQGTTLAAELAGLADGSTHATVDGRYRYTIRHTEDSIRLEAITNTR